MPCRHRPASSKQSATLILLNSIENRFPANPRPSDWWVILGAPGPFKNIMFLICLATKRTGKILGATDEEVAAAEREDDLKYPYTGDESRIEIDEAVCSPSSATLQADTGLIDRSWRVAGVMDSGDSQDAPALIVLCELTLAHGLVFDFLDAELAEAKALPFASPT